MFSAESSGLAPDWLWSLMSWARWSAQLSPAGPAPTMSTSASSCSRGTATLLGLLQLFGQSGHDFEDVSDNAIVGNLEDGGVLVLVDRNNGARALHADDVLNGAADAQRKIKLRCHGLAGAPDLALHRKPAFVADGSGGSDFRAQSFGHCFRLSDVFRRLDAAADRDDQRSLSEIDGGLGFLEKLQRLGAYLFGLQLDRDLVDRLCTAIGRQKLVGAKGPGLKGRKPRAGAGKRNVRGGFPLEHLANENEPAAFVAIADRVADHAFAEHGCEFRSEVAHLIGVGEKDQIRFRRLDYLLERDAEPVGRVVFEQPVLHLQNLGDVFRREFGGKRVQVLADDDRTYRARSRGRDL